MRRLACWMLACGLLAAAGCGGGEDDPPAGGKPTAATPTATPEDTGGEQATGCDPARPAAPRQVDLSRPRARLDRARTYVATVDTSCGTFAITLDARRAPRTGGAFRFLARRRYFDGLAFHRVVPGFVIQGGDPSGNGTGGPGFSVVERPPGGLAYTKGVVAMAKTPNEPPGSSGSQFFVVTGEDAELQPEYALLGRVTSGQDVVDRIGLVPVDAQERPVAPVVIRSVRVTTR